MKILCDPDRLHVIPGREGAHDDDPRPVDFDDPGVDSKRCHGTVLELAGLPGSPA